MQSLLHKCTHPGYPVDYLVSRIRGRSGQPVKEEFRYSADGGTFQADDTLIWSAAADERYWLYRQIDNGLREALAPVLLYFELNTLVLCLRSLEAHQADSQVIDLEKSIMADGLKKIVTAKIPLSETISKLERYLENSVLNMKGLAAAYQEKGIQGAEELIRKKFLQQVIDSCTHPEAAIFFRRIIDLKNILTMAKCVRWKKEVLPDVISGGDIRLVKDEQVASQASLEKMVRRSAGGIKISSEDLHPVRLEPLLHIHLSKSMRRRMRSGDPVCICIGHMWNCFEVARKRSREYQEALFSEKFTDTLESTH